MPLGRGSQLLIVVWAVAIVLDAVTTLGMMHSGRFEEANPVAARGMDVLGVSGYIAAASILSAGYAMLGFGQATGLRTRAAVSTIATMGVYKLCVGSSNAILALTGWDAPLL